MRICSLTVPTVYVSNQRSPEWRVVAERQHLIVERQFADEINTWAVATACGLIVTPSATDTRLNAEDYADDVPRCRSCEVVEEDVVDQPHRARTS